LREFFICHTYVFIKKVGNIREMKRKKKKGIKERKKIGMRIKNVFPRIQIS